MSKWGFIGLVVLAVAAVVFIPMGTIWALNALFGLSIDITLKTWAAALLLGLVVSGNHASSS